MEGARISKFFTKKSKSKNKNFFFFFWGGGGGGVWVRSWGGGLE